jgi:Probable zinc-ribbon domain
MGRLSMSEQLAEQERNDRQRKKRLFEAAKTFARKVAGSPSIHEVALCGSMVTEDPYPQDIDIAIVADSFSDLPLIARAARQISSTYHGWEVFVFRPDRTYAGRICHRRECPTQTARCDKIDCGRVPHLGNIPNFDFDSVLFLSPPIEILWCRESKSMLLNWKKALGAPATEPTHYYRPIILQCGDCGNQFIFSVARQKHFADRGFRRPKRCEPCQIRREFGPEAASLLEEIDDEKEC